MSSSINPPAAGLQEGGGPSFDWSFWDSCRHRRVGGTAGNLLSASARKGVRPVLQAIGASNLHDVATWADDTKKQKKPKPSDDEDTLKFLADPRNKNRSVWHYVNLPDGADGYSRTKYPDFTSDEDVVQMLAVCAKVLMGASDRFTRPNALRLLVHLAGDVHQPLHVGCGYLRKHGGATTIVTDPDAAKGLPDDQGGNLLFPEGLGGANLHGLWDEELGGNCAPNVSPLGAMSAAVAADDASERTRRAVAEQLGTRRREDAATAPTSTTATGASAATFSPETMAAAAWASETLLAARKAYESIRITGTNGGDGYVVDVGRRDAYLARCRPIVE
jgi:S1/P1 Nuclease